MLFQFYVVEILILERTLKYIASMFKLSSARLYCKKCPSSNRRQPNGIIEWKLTDIPIYCFILLLSIVLKRYETSVSEYFTMNTDREQKRLLTYYKTKHKEMHLP